MPITTTKPRLPPERSRAFQEELHNDHFRNRNTFRRCAENPDPRRNRANRPPHSQAVRRSYDVTVMVRLPEKVADMKRAKFVVGDSRDEKVLSQAVKARYAVISALGTPASPFREVTLLSTSTRALVSAMKAERVPRFVTITGMGAGDAG